MERFESIKKADKIDNNRIYTKMISSGSVQGSKYSKLSNKSEKERSQQISLDNNRWIVFNIDDNNNDILPIQRKLPQLTKENTQLTQKLSCKNQQKDRKFQLSFASIDTNIQLNDSFIQSKSRYSNVNGNPFKKKSSVRSIKKDITLTECSSFQSPKKQNNKPSIYKYADKPSKNNKSSGALAGLRQVTMSKSQIKIKSRVEKTQKSINSRKNQSKEQLLGGSIPTQQNQKDQLKEDANKSNKQGYMQRQRQFLMLFDPIQLLQRHSYSKNEFFYQEQIMLQNQPTKLQKEENIKAKQTQQKQPLYEQVFSIERNSINQQGFKELINDFMSDNTNYILQNIQEKKDINVQKAEQLEQICESKIKQALLQNSHIQKQKINHPKQENIIKVLHSYKDQSNNRSEFQSKSIYTELKMIENIRIIKLQCGIGSSLIPQRIEDSFVSSIPSSSSLHRKYRNDQLVSLINAIILINPKIIKNMFIPSNNGYSCKLFYLGVLRIVEVDCEIVFDLNYYPIFGEAGQFLWFSVLIKALAHMLGSFEAVTSLNAIQAFSIITGEDLYRLDLKNPEINGLEILQRARKEKGQNKILMVRKDEIFYFISKLQTKKQKFNQSHKKRGFESKNEQKGQQKYYRSLSRFLKKQSTNLMKKKLYNETTVELKQRQTIHKISLNTLLEEGFEVIVSECMFTPEQIVSFRSAITKI